MLIAKRWFESRNFGFPVAFWRVSADLPASDFRKRGVTSNQAGLGKDIVEDVAVDVGEPEIAASVAEGELFVV